ncbi:MAG TPA: YceI family protein [Flavobacterium sp.]|nr:YceI family protein [Flavobacterium sp.]
MKNFLLIFLFFSYISIVAQDKKTATNGQISFEASVPFYEAVEAKNNRVFSILNTKKSEITIVAMIKDFHFERSLMEDHFNAHYMESRKYPKATFKGVIEKFSINKMSSSSTDYYLKGKIEIHGVTKNIRVLAKLSQTAANEIEIQSKFSLNTEDFKIDIPYIVRSKISKNVNVELNITLK